MDFGLGVLATIALVAMVVATFITGLGFLLLKQCNKEFKKPVKIGYMIVSQSWVFLVGAYYLDPELTAAMGGQTAKVSLSVLTVVITFYFLNYLRKVIKS